MSGKDNNDDDRSDLDKWLDAQRVEVDKIRRQLQDGLDREVRSWQKDNVSSSSSSSPMRGSFERFKNFVDTNFSTFAQGFKNFPSNVSELKARMQQEREARRHEELEISRRWVGCDDSPDHIRMQVERRSKDEDKAVKDATYMLLRESWTRNKHVDPQKILALYKDNEWSFGSLDQFATPMLSLGGACFYKAETVDNLPSTARWGWPTPKPQWLSVDWFKRSPYSPIRLEAHPDLHNPDIDTAIDPRWRAAFEDLLSAALDKPMKSTEKIGQRPPYGTVQSTYHGAGLDWMLSLQCRGILPPQLPSLYRPVRLFDGFDEANRPRAAEFMHDIHDIVFNQSTRMYPLVKRDLHLLMDEIATKSGPPALDPFAFPKKQDWNAWARPSEWRVPDTEEELYDDMPPYTDLVKPIPEALVIPTMTGEKFVDRANTVTRVWEALDDEDATVAAKCLDAYEKTHKDAQSIITEIVDHTEDMTVRPPWDALLEEMLDKHDLAKSKVLGSEQRFLNRADEGGYDKFGRKLHDTADSSKGQDVAAEMSEQQQQPVIKPDILSQLTTTQTTRLPDGTVTTKVVLKQRFADGREETHESVQTSREEQSQAQQFDLPKPKPKQTEVEQPGKKKGWFWN